MTHPEILNSLLFTPGEFTILHTLTPAQQEHVIQDRTAQMEATNLRIFPTQESTTPSKTGEPNWEEVKHDAQRALGKKLLDERPLG